MLGERFCPGWQGNAGSEMWKTPLPPTGFPTPGALTHKMDTSASLNLWGQFGLPREKGAGRLARATPTSRGARTAGNTFHTKQGNRLSCRDQEGRWGSDEVGPGLYVFHSREPGISGNFMGRNKGAKYRFPLQDGTCDFPGDAVAGKGLIL